MSKPAELPWTWSRATARALEPGVVALRLACPRVWADVPVVEVEVVVVDEAAVDVLELPVAVVASSPPPLVRATTRTTTSTARPARSSAPPSRERRGAPPAGGAGAPPGRTAPPPAGGGGPRAR